MTRARTGREPPSSRARRAGFATRRALVAAIGIAILGLLNYLILDRQRIVDHGEIVYLELAPADPRSLMQGDYMRLRYRVEREAGEATAKPRAGSLVIRTDARGVAALVRVHDGTPLAAGERLVRYRRAAGVVRVAPDAFFFQEGHAARYEAARYGTFRFDGAHRRVLVGLADEAFAPLGSDPPAPPND